MEMEIEGLMHEIEGEIDRMFPDVEVLGYWDQPDGSITVELFTPNEDREEIEEELANKSENIKSDFEFEVVFYVYDKSSDDWEEKRTKGRMEKKG